MFILVPKQWLDLRTVSQNWGFDASTRPPDGHHTARTSRSRVISSHERIRKRTSLATFPIAQLEGSMSDPCICKCSVLPWYLTVVFYRTVVCLALCVFCATVNVINVLNKTHAPRYHERCQLLTLTLTLICDLHFQSSGILWSLSRSKVSWFKR